MSVTRGGPNKAKRFSWHYDGESETVVIENEDGRVLRYRLGELERLLQQLANHFGSREIPLANNVEKLGNGSEQPGLGMALLSIRPRDIGYAQGSSYLGVVLEELGYFRWNERNRGIGWQLFDIVSAAILLSRLNTYKARNGDGDAR